MASSMLTAEVSAAASKEADVDEALKSALHSCANDPDFAIICDFLQKFSKDLGLDLPNFKLLLQWLTKTDEVSPQLREMQIKLLRKTRKTVHEKSWESALSKFCFTYSAQDAWEIERFGYKNSSVKVKLRILRELLECQFERNAKFRAKILTLSADSLRSQPIGRDRLGHAYWVTQDNDCNIRIYQEHLDEEIWQVVATNRDEFVNLIKRLRASEVVLPCTDIGLIDEDTTSSSGSSNIDSISAPKIEPPEENDDSQEDEQKVPKLSIKLVHGKNAKEPVNNKDVGKGEEELAAEEDAQKLKKSSQTGKEANESGDEEFEEVEEEYEDESEGSEGESEAEEEEEEDKKISKKKETEKEQNLKEATKTKEDDKKVKPLLISQNKVLNTDNNTSAAKKRALDQVDAASPPRKESVETSALKKSRPSLMDSKRSKTSNKYEDDKEMGEEDLEEESAEEDEGEVEEEIEEEDIDSVAAEEDENEEKEFEDDDDDDEDEENEVGEEITDPVVHVKGEGSGKDCDAGIFFNYLGDYATDYEDENYVGEEIVEEVCYVYGEGLGKECLVGNTKEDEAEEQITNCNKSETQEVKDKNIETKLKTETESDVTKLKEVVSKESVPKDDNKTKETEKLEDDVPNKNINSEECSTKDTENAKEINVKDEKNKINGENKTKTEIIDKNSTKSSEIDAKISTEDKKPPENTSKEENDKKEINKIDTKSNSDTTNATSQFTHANKMSVLESLKKELRESKQKLLEKKAPAAAESSAANKLTSPAIYNRKRRLTDQQPPIVPVRPPNSESEIDLNSENNEEATNEQDLEMDDMDVGGKRLKMRPKQTNSELRKKIEAQKVAANDETTSSSGGEEELRRKKKISLAKEETTTETKTLSPVKTAENSSPQQQPITLKKQITPTKVKPTLDEIIEKKLKKTPEKIDKDSSATDNGSSVVVATSAKTLFPSPNKSPITKPLKKNLLTQIRQEESDEDAVPRKRTNSEDLTNQPVNETSKNTTTKDAKQIIVTKIDPERQQRTTPERQRKRRSSEETVPHDSPEEPEAKKEVLVAKEKDIITKLDKTPDTIKEEEVVTESKDVEIKRESPTPTSGRRSGRRSGATPAYVKTSLQTKRNRGATKKEVKKESNESEKPVAAAAKEEKEIKEENAAANSKDDVKEKPQPAVKSSIDKTSTVSKTKEDETVKTTKKKPEPTSKPDETTKPKTSPTTKTPPKGQRKKREVDATNIIDTESETPVRQSRRIAQQKIREEAERRKLEEIALRTMKQELKKKKKAEKQADPTVVPPATEPSSESEESDVETKKKVQKKKCPGKNGNWSSGSEEQEEPEEEDEEPPHYDTDPGSPLFKSDHEFSPESEIEDESQVVPMKRARTVRKEDAGDDANAEEEEACQKCNKSDHPEWILLCDNCDKGYHCSCLSPVLFYIPEGDWYCPPCQQEQLIKALENQLKEFDDLVENKRKEEEEVKRLAEEEKARLEKEEAKKRGKSKPERKTNAKRNKGDSSEEDDSKDDTEDEESSTNSEDSSSKKRSAKNKNAKRSKNTKKSDKRNNRERRGNANRSRRGRQQKRRDSGSEESDSHDSKQSKSDSESKSSSSSTYSDSDNEPIYKLRKRRQINVSYRLNEYDDLINSALKKEMDEAAGAGNLGRGKDISTIIEADKEEKARQKHIDDGDDEGNDGVKSKEGEEKDVKDKEKEENKSSEVKRENSSKTDADKTEIKKEKKDDTKKEDDEDEDDSDAEPIIRKFNIKPSQKKKSRKLTTLDISSEDDDASDEDFKGSSFEDDEEEDTSISASNSDSSLEIYKRHGKSKKKRRKAARRAFRERRKDRRFVVDESDDEEVQRPKSKKKRKDDSDYTETEVDDDDLSELSENIDSADLCDDTTTDESDGAWRPNKRKKAKKSNTAFSQKSPKTKINSNKKPKKVEYSDDDVSETESEEDDDDDNDNVGSGKGMGGKQPRSQPLKTSTSAPKTKGKGKEKPPAKTKKKKKSSESEESKSGSEDSTRRTRGRRYAYIEDFDDDSSDGGIKPGVQRPDTPPEEREKFIKRQEEIKRMLAEKNAEGAKLAATPRLTPIKADGDKDKRSPAKAGGDSLSTVPLSVIRQAKVLDIDYLQRRGESLDDLGNDIGDVDDDFDAELPDDLPEDMDEDAIARMVEEEEELNAAAARDLPTPDEVLRTPPITKPTIKVKEFDKPILPATMPSSSSFLNTSPQVAPTPLTTATTTTSASGLQEPVRKRLPMPTMHPPLLRHQFLMHESMANTHHLMQRHGAGPPPPHTSHLLQNALSAPLSQPLDRNYPHSMPSASHQSLLNRMVQNMPLQSQLQHSLSTTRPSATQHPPHPSTSSTPTSSAPTSLIAKALSQPEHLATDKPTNPPPVTENKPRGRRKKITPLRDPLQKQQTAAAVTAAAATNSALASAIVKKNEQSSSSPVVAGSSSSSPMPPSVIKTGNSPSKLPMQTSVIQSMPPTSPSTHPAISNRPGVQMPPITGAYGRSDGPRYYEPPGNRLPPSTLQQRHRGPPQLPPSLLPPHPANRSTYGPPPPLKGSSSAASLPPTSSPSSTSNSPAAIRNPLHHVPPPYLGMPPNARHAAAHLNMYSRPPIYGNPNFGPRVNLRPPPNIHAPEYAAGTRAYPPYGFYPPPPPLTTPPGQRSGPAGPPPRAPTQMPPIAAATNLTQPPASVIVSAVAAAAAAAAVAKSSNSNPTALTKPTPPPPNPTLNNSEVKESSSKPSLVQPEATNKQSPSKPPPTPPSTSSHSTVKTPVEKPVTPAAATLPIAPSTPKETEPEPRKKLTTLQAFSSSSSNSTTKKSPERSANDSATTQNSPLPRSDVQDDSSAPATASEEPESRPEGQASEFSGLVSYFSSQHDDYNT